MFWQYIHQKIVYKNIWQLGQWPIANGNSKLESMTNREKYHFDDFTLENYQRLIRLAKEKGFQFILHKDEFVPERKDIIWRHDVEFEPDIALRMAQIEKEEGVVATYFFQLHSPYYNLFDEHYSKVFHQIYKLGHHCGLHFDCRYWGISDEKQLDEFITLDCKYLEANLGVKMETFSFHNTTPFTQSCLEYRYGGLINVYSSYFKRMSSVKNLVAKSEIVWLGYLKGNIRFS